MRPLNILILTDYYPPHKLGGVGEIAKRLKSSYEDLGHKAHVLTTGKSCEQEKRNNVVRTTKSLTLGIIVNNFIAPYLIKKHRINVIHLHQSSTTLFLVLRIFRTLIKFPFIINSFQVTYFSEFKHIKPVKVGSFTIEPTFYELIEKYFYAPIHIFLDTLSWLIADITTVVSSENKKEVLSTYGKLLKRPIAIIPNGVAKAVFTNTADFRDADFESHVEGKDVLIYVGVFRLRKRVFNLLIALKEALKSNDRLLLVLVGSGRGQEEALRKTIRTLEIESHVFFTGPKPNETIPYYLQKADIFCLPSSYEGMPVAILEAMAMEKVILTSKVSGMMDLVKDAFGRLVEVDDIESLSQHMVQLTKNRGTLRAMGLAAAKEASENYQWNDIAQKYLQLISS